MNDENSLKVVVSPIFHFEGDLFSLGNQELAPVIQEMMQQLFGALGITARNKRKTEEAEGEALLIRTRAEIEANTHKRRAENRAEIDQLEHEAEIRTKLLQLHEDLHGDSLMRRGVARAVLTGIEHEHNIEEIARRALPHLRKDAKPGEIPRGWMNHFVNVAQSSTDEELRELWARVLAGESNKRGSFGKLTMHILSTIDPIDAQAFAALVRFGWDQPYEHRPVITNLGFEIFRANGVTFDSLQHLDEIGLISFMSIGEYSYSFPPKEKLRSSYHERSFWIEVGADRPQINFGKVMLSRAGVEIARICERSPVPGYADTIVQHWRAHGCIVTEEKRE